MKKFIILLKRMYFRMCLTVKKADNAGPVSEYNKRSTSDRPEPEDNIKEISFIVEKFLREQYEFRYNLLTEATEFRRKNEKYALFRAVGQRELNSFCLEARRNGIDCWDRDVSRYVQSADITAFHPMQIYMNSLPEWDGNERVKRLAQRVSNVPLWLAGFHRWMLGLVAQWLQMESQHANSVAPVLYSKRQGMHKSTFCKMLLPDMLQDYYTDSFDLNSLSGSEQKLTVFGLINLDEMDKFSEKKMALLKNLMQMAALNIRKAYKKNYSALPRIASFIATSNRKDLLTDPSGSRRFLCVEVLKKIDCTPFDHVQVYAQLKAELKNGARYWFTTEEEQEIMKNNIPFQRCGMEEDVFYDCFRIPGAGETGEMLSAAEIFNRLKKQNPSAMREVNTYTFGKMLTAAGIERKRTEKGNRYHVIPVAG